MEPEMADKLLTIDQNILDKFLKDNVEVVRTLHNWILERAAVLDAESIDIMYQFFNKFLIQATMLIQKETDALKRPPC
jgi:hypothetical protein